MNCKNCGEPAHNGIRICKSCGHNFYAARSIPSNSSIEPLDDSGYKLGPNVLAIFVGWCALHVYLLSISLPSRVEDITLFWPFDKHSSFNNYDYSEFVFFILFPAICLCIANFFAENKPENTARLNQNYDLNYYPDAFPVFFGVFMLVAYSCLFIKLQSMDASPVSSAVNSARLLLLIIFASRIAAIWVTVKLARDLNRDDTNWGIFSFFFPAIALIILAQKKKLRF